MTKMKKIQILILILMVAAVSIYLCMKSFGFRISTLCSLLTLSGFARKSSYEFGIYSTLRSVNNPLYSHFRKNSGRILSELKGMYFCQIYILIQTVVFMGYGVMSVLTNERWYLFEILMVIFAWLPMLLSQGIQESYEDVLKLHRKRNAKIRRKEFFALAQERLEAEIIPIPRKGFSEIEPAFLRNYRGKGYVLWDSYRSGEGEDIGFYFKDEEQSLKICQLVQSDGGDIPQLCRRINETGTSFIREYKGSGLNYKDMEIAVIIFTENVAALLDMVNHPVVQEPNRCVLFAVVSCSTGEMYISRCIGTCGIEKYEAMRNELVKAIES